MYVPIPPTPTMAMFFWEIEDIRQPEICRCRLNTASDIGHACSPSVEALKSHQDCAILLDPPLDRACRTHRSRSLVGQKMGQGASVSHRYLQIHNRAFKLCGFHNRDRGERQV